jgi:hypothetical protein
MVPLPSADPLLEYALAEPVQPTYPSQSAAENREVMTCEEDGTHYIMSVGD